MAARKTLQRMGATIHYDLVNMMLGEQLGQGTTRSVFVNDLNPQQVVKVAHRVSEAQHANVIEWEMWKELCEMDSPLKKFFAPCRFISPNGNILIMDRTEQPLHYPEWIPKVMCDLKLTNFGCLENGQFVCHDYGMLLFEHGLMDARFVRAKWWRTRGIPRTNQL